MLEWATGISVNAARKEKLILQCEGKSRKIRTCPAVVWATVLVGILERKTSVPQSHCQSIVREINQTRFRM